MAATPSTMISLGTQASPFALRDPATGKILSLDDVKGEKGLLAMFICNHCPFVKYVASESARIGHVYMPKGLGVVAIDSNDVESYPDDSPVKNGKPTYFGRSDVFSTYIWESAFFKKFGSLLGTHSAQKVLADIF